MRASAPVHIAMARVGAAHGPRAREAIVVG
jgi:hypothetical protein